MDDLIVFSNDIDQHIRHLKNIFDKLSDGGLTIKLRKSEFFHNFLEHIISSEGIKMKKQQIEIIQKFPTPTNAQRLKGFLGLVNYDSRFCKNYLDVTIP